MVYVGYNANDLRSGRVSFKTAQVDLNNSVMEPFSAEIQHLKKVLSCYQNELYSCQLVVMI
jgi:hypothetical protein